MNNIVTASKVHIADFANDSPEFKAGKIELLGAFIYHMEEEKKTSYATESDFRQALEVFKTFSL